MSADVAYLRLPTIIRDDDGRDHRLDEELGRETRESSIAPRTLKFS